MSGHYYGEFIVRMIIESGMACFVWLLNALLVCGVIATIMSCKNDGKKQDKKDPS